jgi:hypothetical protein
MISLQKIEKSFFTYTTKIASEDTEEFVECAIHRPVKQRC